MNGTLVDKHLVVNNGRYDHQSLIKVEEWNGLTELPEYFWPAVGPTPQTTQGGHGGVCRKIQGTLRIIITIVVAQAVKGTQGLVCSSPNCSSSDLRPPNGSGNCYSRVLTKVFWKCLNSDYLI